MHSHLVTVEIRVECGAHQRVQLNRFAFDQNRFERLNTETVQRRCAVQHDRMLADDLIQNVPDFAALLFDQFLGGLDRRRKTTTQQLVEDERLEQLQRHFLRQATLVQLQCRAHDDHRTPRVVDTFTQQVLTETPLLALDHVSQ